MKAFFKERITAEEVASKYGYSVSTVYTMTKALRRQFKENPNEDPFFIMPKKGRPFRKNKNQLDDLIISLRKKNLSVPDIKTIIDTRHRFDKVSESYIDYLLKEEGFSRLPRRDNYSRERKKLPEKIKAQKSEMILPISGRFSSSDIGILCFLPIIRKYKIDILIQKSSYPQTKVISKNENNEEVPTNKECNQTWARLIQKVYEVDPMICPKCQSQMKVIAIIFDKDEIKKILACHKKNKSPPFDKIEVQEEAVYPASSC
jgi:transposase